MNNENTDYNRLVQTCDKWSCDFRVKSDRAIGKTWP